MKKITGKKLVERLIARTQLSYGLSREKAIERLILTQYQMIKDLAGIAGLLTDKLKEEIELSDLTDLIKKKIEEVEAKKDQPTPKQPSKSHKGGIVTSDSEGWH